MAPLRLQSGCPSLPFSLFATLFLLKFFLLYYNTHLIIKPTACRQSRITVWLTLCNNLGPRQQQNVKVPAFIGFSELQSPAVSTSPKVQELLVFFFPLRSSNIFRSSGKKSNCLYSSSSFSLYNTLSNSPEMQGSLLQGDHCAETFFLMCCIFHVLVARFVFSMNSKSKSQE